MEPKEKKALWITIVFILLSVGVFSFLKGVLKLEDGIAYTSIILLPIIVYVILADKVKSFKAGDIEATFKEVANTKVKTGEDSIEQLTNNHNLDVIEKGSVDQLRQELSNLKFKSDLNKIILTLELGRQGYYNQDVLSRYVKCKHSANPIFPSPSPVPTFTPKNNGEQRIEEIKAHLSTDVSSDRSL